MPKDGRKLRCAVYTRKSTEEGLDKAFNSLDAQREACAAYVLSQQHEGWTLAPDIYDDGGYSGGNLDRPALRQLLDDVKARRVDIVVVYKIDRLTRSLSDFARIVDVLDAADASFVSITQAFSTTTSMGRLTLNVLLSFAQFEREVGAERIRDKIAASKAKGMWMGGGVPLGYQAKDRELQVIPEEAGTVRLIMERYLASDSIRTLVDELRYDGILSKIRVGRDGSKKGGNPLKRGALSWLLSNRIYVGEIVHKGTVYPGKHDAIVSRELFDAVQKKLAERTASPASGSSRKRVSLLAGMIRDHRDRPMSPCHTRNHGRRYLYYASSMNDDADEQALRLPAGDLEGSVRTALAGWLGEGENIRALASGRSAEEQRQIFRCCSQTAKQICNAPIIEARALLTGLNTEVSVNLGEATVSFSISSLLSKAGVECENGTVTVSLPTNQAYYGHEPRLRLEPASRSSKPRDERLVELLGRAFAGRERLLAMDENELDLMPTNRLRHLQRTARLSYLDPQIIRTILNGEQPSGMNARKLWRMADLPIEWSGQRKVLQLQAN